MPNLGRFCYPKSNRLVTNADFVSVLKKHRRLYGQYFTLMYQMKPSSLPTRLGVAVGKKCHKSAVVRNRIKRIMREQFRQQAPTIKHLDIMLQAKKAAASAKRADLHQELCQLFAQLG